MAAAARNLLIFVLLAGAAGGTSMLLTRPQQPEAEPARAAGSDLQGYYMRDAVILGTAPDGSIAYRIFAALAEQPRHEQSLTLTDVRVEYDQAEGVPWRLTAASGTVADGGGLLKLFGVRLSHGEHGGDPIVVETQELELDPDTHMARADSPVTLRRAGGTLEARGFSADLKENRVDLEGGHGTFDR